MSMYNMASRLYEFFFHRHTFNPDKWVEVSGYEFKTPDGRVVRKQYNYTNTCLACGELCTRTMDV